MKKVRGLGLNKHFPGRLFVVEGCDGSGKSTQIYLLKKWLMSLGYTVFFTEWNSSLLIKEATSKAKRKDLLTPTTFSLVHASDFADRYEKLVLPPLRAGYIVLCDRYIYTAYARDIARGCDHEWVRTLYDFAVTPTLTLYFQVALDISVNRILIRRKRLKYHEAGMDLEISKDPLVSFTSFQGMIKANYDSMISGENFKVIDASKGIAEQQSIIRAMVEKKLLDYKPPYINNNTSRIGD